MPSRPTAASGPFQQALEVEGGPAAEVVPRLADARVLEGFDASGQPRLRPPKRPVTLRHLLTHTSGFAYDIWSEDVGRYMAATGTPGITSCRDKALTIPLLYDPGECWTYGIGIDWAGKMVEAVTGNRLGEHLRKAIFEPLGMADTAFVPGPSQKARLARVHARGPDGKLVPTDFAMPAEPEFEMGGGGLYSTARSRTPEIACRPAMASPPLPHRSLGLRPGAAAARC